ncbi:ABC transporter substrate-binding protein [Pseudoxanthobacter sp.]|uniref:ABC transporter substrate-binding protein n=1 Tax=Pseudoxanthobacter sp. TaxID=1925742 RepID=UPI002FE12E61
MLHRKVKRLALALGAAALFATTAVLPAAAEVTVGVIVSMTGPGAAMGVDIKRAINLIPARVGDEPVRVVLLDDATDPTAAVRAARRLITEEKADVILGPTVNALIAAVVPVVDEAKVPMIGLSPYVPPADKAKFVFRSVQDADLMVGRIVEEMQKRKIRTAGFIGFADAWGDLLYKDFSAAAEKAGIRLTGAERYNRLDTSVTAQVLKIMAGRPEAVFIGGSATPATLPQIELRKRGYKGLIFQSHGVASREFIRVGGKDVEGTLLPVGPVLVAEQLPDSHPSKPVAMAFDEEIEKANGPGTRSSQAGTAWDAWLLVQNALPKALEAAKPGTEAFHLALRDALENTRNLVGVHGVYNMTPENHTGLDERARVLVEVTGGGWKLVN